MEGMRQIQDSLSAASCRQSHSIGLAPAYNQQQVYISDVKERTNKPLQRIWQSPFCSSLLQKTSDSPSTSSCEAPDTAGDAQDQWSGMTAALFSLH